ncbi:kinase-like domain-containing protein [Hysterangium stoloniferum]|nr:kinase-like domain-containing protein [Hysterangium stoloniferum]
MLLPYWDHSGQLHHLEGQPESFGDWQRGNELCTSRQGLHNAVEAILNHNIVSTRCLAKDMNTTLDVTLDNGSAVIVRQRHQYPSDPILEKWALDKFNAEIRLFRWLKDNSSIPVPAVIAVDHMDSNFSIQEKLPGSTLANEWHFLPLAMKDWVISNYIDLVLELFRIPVPQRIGSVLVEVKNGTHAITVGPRIGVNPSQSCPTVIEDVFEYVRFFVALKRKAVRDMEPDAQQRAEETLSYVERSIMTILKSFNDPSLFRCVLTHGDLHSFNILVNKSGNITAVLDWEINSIQPAIFSASYPIWLSDDGVRDPGFAASTYWWDESPEERKRICAQFETIVRERDQLYYNCLRAGRNLRSAVDWLTDHHPDPGFDNMRSWATVHLR